MTIPKFIIRFPLLSIGLAIQGMAALLGTYISLFTAFYVAELLPHLIQAGSMQEADLYFETICKTYPRSLLEGIQQCFADLTRMG